MGQIQTRAGNYVGLDLNFFSNPNNNDVSVATGNDAIKASIRNLILTNFYERPFRPSLGSGVWQLLFDLNTPITAIFIQNAITATITNFEPRVKLNKVTVLDDPDSNAFNVQLSYILNDTNTPVIDSLFLSRIR